MKVVFRCEEILTVNSLVKLLFRHVFFIIIIHCPENCHLLGWFGLSGEDANPPPLSREAASGARPAEGIFS